MTLFSDRGSLRDWAKDDCGNSDAKGVEDLQPYLELLLRTFRYNWIYASGDGNYNAFQPQSAPRFDAVIRQAQTAVFATKVH
jgi:hypothetical protein